MGLDDTNLGKVYLYVGMKRDAGNPIEEAGLHGGDLFAVAIQGTPVELRDPTLDDPSKWTPSR